MFYSATPTLGVRKVASLPDQGNPSRWTVVSVSSGVQAYFDMLGPWTNELGRIICAATGFPVYHAEIELTEDAPDILTREAESLLGLPYDFEGALLAVDNSGFHTFNRWWCDEFVGWVILALVPGLDIYVNPGTMLMNLNAMLGRKAVELVSCARPLDNSDLAYLDSLVPEKVSTGVMQRFMENRE